MDRIAHIDAAKGVGMMLIVVSHVWVDSNLSSSTAFRVWDSVINSFYVPLFFILSGVFEPQQCNWKKYHIRIKSLFRYVGIFALFGFISMGVIRSEWGINGVLHGTTVWFLIVLLWISVIWGIVKAISCKLAIISVLAIGGGICHILIILCSIWGRPFCVCRFMS